MKLPHPLRPGDRVALLALSSPAKTSSEATAAAAALRMLGYRVSRGASLRASRDYLAGPWELRARDFQTAIADPDIRAIFFLRGGYGSAQLLPAIDWRAVARARKPIVGFSDLTSVLNATLRAGLGTLHAPTLASHFVAKSTTGPALQWFRRILADPHAEGSLQEITGGYPAEPLHPGNARGPLIGGNLIVFATLLGTRWLPKPDGRILFLEDVNEAPYAIDRALTHLRNSGYLERLAGIAFGQFDRCDPPSAGRWDAKRAAAEALRGLRLPALWGIPTGHGHPSFALPLGRQCTMHTKVGDLQFGKIVPIKRLTKGSES